MQKLILKETDPSAPAIPRSSRAPALEAKTPGLLNLVCKLRLGLCMQVWGDDRYPPPHSHIRGQASLLSSTQGLSKKKLISACGQTQWCFGTVRMSLFLTSKIPSQGWVNSCGPGVCTLLDFVCTLSGGWCYLLLHVRKRAEREITCPKSPTNSRAGIKHLVCCSYQPRVSLYSGCSSLLPLH